MRTSSGRWSCCFLHAGMREWSTWSSKSLPKRSQRDIPEVTSLTPHTSTLMVAPAKTRKDPRTQSTLLERTGRVSNILEESTGTWNAAFVQATQTLLRSWEPLGSYQRAAPNPQQSELGSLGLGFRVGLGYKGYLLSEGSPGVWVANR